MSKKIHSEAFKIEEFVAEERLPVLPGNAIEERDAIIAVYENRKDIYRAGTTFNIRNIVFKVMKVLASKRKMRAMKDNKLPKRRPFFDLLKRITPKRMEVKQYSNMSVPYEVKIIPAESKFDQLLEEFTFVAHKLSSLLSQSWLRNDPVWQEKVRTYTQERNSLARQLRDERARQNDPIKPAPQKDLTREGIEPNPGPKTSLNNNKNKKKQKNRNTRRREGMYKVDHVPITSVPVATVALIPYKSNTTQLNNIGFRYAQDNYNANAAYDKKGSILTNLMVYINNYFDRYAVYIVLTTKVEITITNNEDFQCEFIYTPTILSPLSSANLDTALNATMAIGSVSRVMSAKYGKTDTVKIVKVIKWAKYYGNPAEYMASSGFSSVTGSNPTTGCYHNLTLIGAQNLSAGVSVIFKETDKIKFYGNKPSTNNSLQQTMPPVIVQRELKRTVTGEESTGIVHINNKVYKLVD